MRGTLRRRKYHIYKGRAAIIVMEMQWRKFLVEGNSSRIPKFDTNLFATLDTRGKLKTTTGTICQ